MNDIIWSVQGDDRPGRMLSNFIKDFYFDLLDAKNIRCHYFIDTEIERKIKNIQVRKALLLIIKEAFNNLIRHSNASQVTFSLQKSNDNLEILISDNGIGMDISKSTIGNGLNNMKHRAEQVGGSILFESHVNEGMLVICRVPLALI